MQKASSDIYNDKKHRKRAFWGSIYLFLLLNSFLFLKAIINKSELNPYHVIIVNITCIFVFYYGTYFLLKFVRLIKLKIAIFLAGFSRRKGIKLQTKFKKCPQCDFDFDAPSTECPICKIVIDRYLKIEGSAKEKKREKVWKKQILVTSVSVLIVAIGLWQISNNETSILGTVPIDGRDSIESEQKNENIDNKKRAKIILRSDCVHIELKVCDNAYPYRRTPIKDRKPVMQKNFECVKEAFSYCENKYGEY